MKVNRQGYTERYPITVDWVKDFARKVEGTESYLNNIKHLIIPNSQKFSSIDEKMADIKKRIGFDLVARETESDLKISATLQCNCGTCEHCLSNKADDPKKASMEVILKYIENMIKHEPHLSPPIVISKCRQAEGLNFDDLSIDMEKLTEYIEHNLSKYKKNETMDVPYVPVEPVTRSEVEMNNEAEYFSNTHRSG